METLLKAIINEEGLFAGTTDSEPWTLVSFRRIDFVYECCCENSNSYIEEIKIDMDAVFAYIESRLPVLTGAELTSPGTRLANGLSLEDTP